MQCSRCMRLSEQYSGRVKVEQERLMRHGIPRALLMAFCQLSTVKFNINEYSKFFIMGDRWIQRAMNYHCGDP